MNPNSETHNRASSQSKQAPRRINRSRKGCPECRTRKIKCDEKKPECTQCRNKGRACGIIDGLFRPVSFTPETTSVSSPAAEVSEIHSPRPWPDSPAGNDSSAEARGPLTQTIKSTSIINPIKKYSQTTAISPRSPTQPRHSTPPESQFPLPSNPQRAFKRASTRSQRSLYSQSSPIVPNSNKIGARHALTHKSTFPAYFLEENNQDRIEVAFFLRHFAEGSGKWLDIFTNNRSYFSQHVVQLASQSQLFRYSACAIAAKQLGQMKDSTKVTNNTPQSKITASKLLEVESNIHFTWYGAKYYEKAILLMAQQISQTPNSTSHLSPSDIYQSTGNDANDDADNLGDHGYASSLFRALSACILCAYEDLNATMRAWSGHLDGAIKLIGPLIFLPAIYPDTCGAPQASRALETAFWYSALDDMLNSLILRKRCRLHPDNITLWQRMNLPINNTGDLILDSIDEQDQIPIFLKALIRILYQIINHDIGVSINWTHIDKDLKQWHQALPTEFLSPITQELSDPATVPETWFGSDTCAITMAFYHMARILLLVNQPRDLFFATQKDESSDLLSSYNSLQRDLNQHSMEIIAIAYGMPGIAVQNYMVQPLYFAGRCLSDSKDRESVIGSLKCIEEDVGVFTGYRIRDLSEEWGIPVEESDPPVYNLSHGC